MEDFFKAVKNQALSYDEIIDACRALRRALSSLDDGIIRNGENHLDFLHNNI